MPANFREQVKIMGKNIVTTFCFSAIFSLFALLANSANASEHGHDGADEKFNPVPMIMHHIKDAHDWHLWGEGEDAVSVPLPIILIDGGVHVFLSTEFEHGHAVVKKGDNYYVEHHGKIYKTNEQGTIEYKEDEKGKLVIANEQPLDFSITKNVLALIIASIVIFFLFRSLAKAYKKSNKAPKGLAGILEPLVLFVRDNIARQNIGEAKYARFMPYLLTVFFFIWVNNLLGLIPIIPGGANVTGNIAVTLSLAFITLLITNISANKDYWMHMLWMPGVPVPVRILLAPIELVGIVTKPFALMIRLFANITAGHIVVLSLISLIFIFKNIGMAGVSVPFALFISVLELLVAALQAYVFTMLSALFIGQAVAEHAHDHHDHH